MLSLCLYHCPRREYYRPLYKLTKRWKKSAGVLTKASSFNPAATIAINRSTYSLSYNCRTKNADWVYEKLTTESLKGNKKRKKFKFKEDPKIQKLFKSYLEDFRLSGFSPGHMAPAANHKSSSQTLEDTFYLSNIIPQKQKFNGGYWAKLEKHVRDLTNKYESVEVITGPLFLPFRDRKGKNWVIYQVIGKNDVAVPTHFYKVIVSKNSNKRKKTEAYILPHEEIPSKTPLAIFKTTLKKVEAAAGIKFFSQKNASINSRVL